MSDTPEVTLSGGGPPSNVRAGETLPASTLWTYGSTENEVVLCRSGEEADGITLADVVEGEILNLEGVCYARKTTGIYDGIAIASNFTAGGEFMSGASGVITAYVAAADNRPLGKFLSSGLANETGRILLYSR
jgi:hypothetical protein